MHRGHLPLHRLGHYLGGNVGQLPGKAVRQRGPDNAQADHAVLADLRAASGPVAWVAPARITSGRTCRCAHG